MTNVFDRLIGQEALAADLVNAARAARGLAARLEETDLGAVSMFAEADEPGDDGAGFVDPLTAGTVPTGSAMTHSWLFTGPPGSGRSVAAACFAAALQCTSPDEIGCGECRACTTVLAGTHGDVRHIAPEGLSISVKKIREIVQIAARRPTTGRWQIVIVEDADRLSESGSNALLKAVEEPPERTVFLLCAPSVAPEDVSVTIRSRCRHVALTAPNAEAIAKVLVDGDGIDPEQARWAAGVAGGHVGRARRLATDEQARAQREQALKLARAATREDEAFAAAGRLLKSATETAEKQAAELDAPEREELMTALGAGGTGKGTARPPRGTAGVIKELEMRQKSRKTRMVRDSLDLALVDLAAVFRDALAHSLHAPVTMLHPDVSTELSAKMGAYAGPERMLRCIEAVLICRTELETNVKPKFALDAMMVRLGRELGRRRAG